MIIDSPMRNEGASPSRVGAAASLAVSLGYLIYMPELMGIQVYRFFQLHSLHPLHLSRC
jgi:hypothetical protein